MNFSGHPADSESRRRIGDALEEPVRVPQQRPASDISLSVTDNVYDPDTDIQYMVVCRCNAWMMWKDEARKIKTELHYAAVNFEVQSDQGCYYGPE